MSSTTNSKNANAKDEFQIAREYILGCPLLGQNSPAIKAALEGIEKEEKRRIRDAKLRSKFGGNHASKNNTTTNNNSNNNSNSNSLIHNDEIVVVEKDNTSSDSFVLEGGNDTTIDDMEWQDVRDQHTEEDVVRAIGDSFSMEEKDDESCFLGKTLAKACIDAIAEQQQHNQKPVVVSTPLAAIAVALHVALRSEILGFACTGIPEKKSKTKKSIGFAPPIRELPKTEFLPRGWDSNNHNSNRNQQQQQYQSPDPLRYRKLDTGAVVLTVQQAHLEEGNNSNGTTTSTTTECQVTFCSAKEDSQGPCLKFPLDEHINLDSWNAAVLHNNDGKSKIAPSLHYKNLSGLLSKFCRTFDLGAVQNEAGYNNEPRMVPPNNYTPTTSTTTSSSSNHMEAPGVFSSSSAAAVPMGSTNMESSRGGYTVPTTLDQAFPPGVTAARRRNEPLVDYRPLGGGDFAGDLLPSGLRDPGRLPASGGNLMGPNHPMFAPGNNFPHGHNFPPGNNFPMGGPGSMQPRFDPIVPPCLNNNRNNNNNNHDPLRRRGANGEPNPDHLPPPNSLGNNMFM